MTAAVRVSVRVRDFVRIAIIAGAENYLILVLSNADPTHQHN